MPIYAIGDRHPSIDPTAFVHPDAVIIGDVRIGPESSVWPSAVLRADFGAIIIGAQTSIQDGSIIHCTAMDDTRIGDRCVVGHNAHLEGCRIHDDCLIASGSLVLNGAEVGPYALVGAGAVVGPGKVIPAHARALGVPAAITPDVITEGQFDRAVQLYVENGHRYAAGLKRLD